MQRVCKFELASMLLNSLNPTLCLFSLLHFWPAGSDLIRVVHLAQRHVGRSCEGIGLMTSTVFLSLFLLFVSSLWYICFMVDIVNHRFLELGAILEPGRPPKTDKAAILIDAVRMVNQLRGEAQKLKDSNSNLQEKIKELKVSLLYSCICIFFFLRLKLLFCLISSVLQFLFDPKIFCMDYKENL